MSWRNWHPRKNSASEFSRKRLLENRIVICADCDANRTLAVTSSGQLVCSSCGSDHWMFVSAPILINFRDYCEESIQERMAVDRYFASLQHELVFHQMGESEDMRASHGTAFSKS